jgi:hypothetical protein
VSQRLTIAVPEALYERLQKVKQELNISGICQEALNMAITLTELKIDSFDREKLIERLKLERKALLSQVKEKGFKFGLKTAQNLSYQDFKRIEHRSHIDVSLGETAFEQMWEFITSHEVHNEMGLTEDGLSGLLPLSNENKGAFVEGWIEGVLSVWNDIKDKVNDADLS